MGQYQEISTVREWWAGGENFGDWGTYYEAVVARAPSGRLELELTYNKAYRGDGDPYETRRLVLVRARTLDELETRVDGELAALDADHRQPATIVARQALYEAEDEAGGEAGAE